MSGSLRLGRKKKEKEHDAYDDLKEKEHKEKEHKEKEHKEKEHKEKEHKEKEPKGKKALQVSVDWQSEGWKVGKLAKPLLGRSWAKSLYGGFTKKKSFPVRMVADGDATFDHVGLNMKVSF